MSTDAEAGGRFTPHLCRVGMVEIWPRHCLANSDGLRFVVIRDILLEPSEKVKQNSIMENKISILTFQ